MKNDVLKEIGIRISEKRKQKNYTQEQVAEMMNVSIQMVSNLERGNKAIKIENLIKISEILDVSTDYILTGKYTENDKKVLTEKLSQLDDKNYKMIEMLIDYYTE
ncbi:MAG: helix-turn-helix transcriptional regulator [Ruminococcaceae bacterium]|nr:helix-turn-helix transcriptional regulator [Oscillospiraceae bacterium]